MPDSTGAAKELDPVRMIIAAEENVMGYRQNLILRAWEMAVKAADGDQAALDELIRVHAGIKAIDYALAQKPSVYKFTAPI